MSADDAVDQFLAAVPGKPRALVVEGEAGIGKTTLWLSAVDRARGRGFTVLSARPAAAESVLAYASLADLLGTVAADVLAQLPDPQRLALDRILLRAGAESPPGDQRTVAAGLSAVLARLADAAPVLLAIDDLQWLDTSSVHAIAFAVRRLPAGVSVLAAVRTEPDASSAGSWLQLPRPDAVHRIRLVPMPLGRLHTVLVERLGRSFPRPAMVQIHQVSGGNPFYALELARAMDTDGSALLLPGTLADLVQARIGSLGADVREALLAAACVGAPTVELVASVLGADVTTTVRMLEVAEASGIIGIDGQTVRFTHPLLARGVYVGAVAAHRRAMHRRLADAVEEPELEARHLALAATKADPHTLHALDAAAVSARDRGAPAAAAELVDLAIGLGGGSAERRIRSASYHFDAGDPGRARALLEDVIAAVAPGPLRAEALSLLGMVRMFDDSFHDAASLLERALGEAGDHLALRVPLTVTLAFTLLNAGRLADAVSVIDDAVANAERLGYPPLLMQARSMRVMLRFMRGDGFDEASMRDALALEDPDAPIPMAFRPRMQHTLLLSWTGRLEPAHREMSALRRRCLDDGHESELNFVAFHSVLLEIWRGNFIDATREAEDTMERALQLGGDLPLCLALTVRSALAAYAGNADDARRDATAALAAGRRCDSQWVASWASTVLGFLEVSLGDYQAALGILEPLLANLYAAPRGTELVAAPFIPDAAEALIRVNRFTDAATLLDIVEDNGRRVDRPWMLAVGARCRAQLLAAQGDLDAADLAVERAMTHHERLPMPFERARTQLLLGQLRRRRRHLEDAFETLGEALRTFDALNTPLWADRARSELARVNVRPRPADALTPSERRVAELTASGMTNRDVATALFISPKTVEANLSRVYQKLGIRSRAELGRRMSQPDAWERRQGG